MSEDQKKELRKIVITALMTVVLIVLKKTLQLSNHILLILYLIPYLIISLDTLKEAFEGIMHGEILDESFLMSVASIGALVLAYTKTGEYTEAVAVMLFFSVGELFEDVAVDKSRKNISKLMDIRPDYANIEKDGKLVKVSPESVETGTVITVLPGEKIPLDGVVIEGFSTLDVSALTGESLPVNATEGATVLSSSINLSGVLKIKTTKDFSQSTVAKILELIESSSSKKSRSEDFIKKFSRIYTPAVCISSLILGVIPPIIQLITGTPAQWSVWVYRALTFLVVSCPCALVISIPLSYFAGIGGAGSVGILIKGSNYMETLAKAETVVFDKTGTLTEGVFQVSDINNYEIPKDKLLKYAAAAESHSTHPIAQSILKAYGKTLEEESVTEIQELAGFGVSALVNGKKVLVGNMAFMQKYGIQCEKTAVSGTTVHVSIDGRYAGSITAKDIIKPQSAEAISQLKKCGITKTVMLSGDSRQISEEVGKTIGIDLIYGGLLPYEKVLKIEEIIKNSTGQGSTIFVGDGINDAPVIARADIGMAMGAIGSDSAIEAANVVIMDDNPLKVSKAIRIARLNKRIVHENIVFSICAKAACLVLGAFGLVKMDFAVFADVGVMIIAVLNSIRTLSVRKI